MKIGDKVIVVNKRDKRYGLIAQVLEIERNMDWMTVKFNKREYVLYNTNEVLLLEQAKFNLI